MQCIRCTMQRVVLFVGILSVVRATPFGLDSGDRPTPFRYTFRVEKVEFGNDAALENYEIGSPEEDDYSNVIYDSVEAKYRPSLEDLFGGLDLCGDLDKEETEIPDEGCVYIAHGDVHFVNALSEVDIDDVYNALEEFDMEECTGSVHDKDDVPEGGCYIVNLNGDTLHLIGIYYDDVTDDVDDLRKQFQELELCDVSTKELPEDGCVLIEEDMIGFINVLNEDNIALVLKELGSQDLEECVFDENHSLISTEKCYWVDYETDSIFFLYVNGINESDEDEFDNDQEADEIPDTEVSTQSSVQANTGGDILRQLQSKGFLSRRSSVAKIAKSDLLKKIQSRQQPQERRRRSPHQGRKLIGGRRANHLPKWMTHLQITV